VLTRRLRGKGGKDALGKKGTSPKVEKRTRKKGRGRICFDLGRLTSGRQWSDLEDRREKKDGERGKRGVPVI